MQFLFCGIGNNKQNLYPGQRTINFMLFKDAIYLLTEKLTINNVLELLVYSLLFTFRSESFRFFINQKLT